MFSVVVLGAVTVGQLDQAVIVRQTGVRFPETPRTEEEEGKIIISHHIICAVGVNLLHIFIRGSNRQT